jgi:hypothetical protein
MTFTGTGEVSTTTAFGGGSADFLTVRHLRAAGGNRALGRAMAHAHARDRRTGPPPADAGG